MAHTNYYLFQADSNYDLGLVMGTKFSEEARKAISNEKTHNWRDKLTIAERDLDITQNYFPQFVDEMKGYAEGAGVAFLDLWTVSLESDLEVEDSSARCTNIITNGGTLIGHNEDAEEPGQEDSR